MRTHRHEVALRLADDVEHDLQYRTLAYDGARPRAPRLHLAEPGIHGGARGLADLEGDLVQSECGNVICPCGFPHVKENELGAGHAS